MPKSRLTVAEIQTDDAARALVALYGAFNADFLRLVLSAGWMTDAERRCLAPLADAIMREASKDAA